MRKFVLFAACILAALSINAANVLVENVSLVNQDVSAGFDNAANHTHVQFDISWDQSWRTNTGPGNYDAVWVFVKFQPYGGNYAHATLSTSAGDFSVTTDNGTAATFETVSDGKGVYIYRTGNGGPASINWDDVELKWNYRTDALHDTTSVTVKVFAVEMVYIPKGAFYIGDGNIGGGTSYNGSSNAFRVNNNPSTTVTGSNAYLVTSEAAIAFVATGSTSTTGVYDPFYSTGYTLPAAFPKGYNAFYCMKYETSQRQYVDFFNTLPTSPPSDPMKTARSIGSATRNVWAWSSVNLDDATLTTGGDRACNNLVWADACAFADWACLRPMTELEFEKAARGRDTTYKAIYPMNLEYAWGNTSINLVTTLTNDGTASEGLVNPTTTTANCQYTGTGTAGPLRCGIFAAKNQAANQRRSAGASFYGVMEMSGNLAEMVVSTWKPFTTYTTCTYNNYFSRTVHGNGALAASGNSDVASWNFINSGEVVKSNSGYSYSSCSASVQIATFVMLKGGDYSSATTVLRTSDRSNPPYSFYSGSYNSGLYGTTNYYTTRIATVGFRAVRTAP